MTEQRFKFGDAVQWRSQSAGVVAFKTGKIIEVVPPGALPKTALTSPGGPRNHESYVVYASTATNTKKMRNYWPRVVLLEPVTPPLQYEDRPRPGN